MANWGKKLLGLAAIGGVVAGLVYYFKNNDSCDVEDEFYDDLEDEDFDLDNDLKPVTDREYVPLNPTQKEDDISEDISTSTETVIETEETTTSTEALDSTEADITE